jgi:hypothetical protein
VLVLRDANRILAWAGWRRKLIWCHQHNYAKNLKFGADLTEDFSLALAGRFQRRNGVDSWRLSRVEPRRHSTAPRFGYAN